MTTAASAPTATIGYAGDGRLMVEELAAEDLARRFGTPSYVVSEGQLRLNYRALRQAFASRYPVVKIAYAVKANNGAAVCAVLADEGCGAECFGLGELSVCRRAGVPAELTWLNGSDKKDPELAAAIERGHTISVDNPEELTRIQAIAAEHGRVARINLRVKLALAHLADVTLKDYRYVPPEIHLTDWTAGHKFGMTEAEAIGCVEAALGDERIDPRGLHYHLKGQTPHADYYGETARELIELAARVRDATGWTPAEVDLGGGFAYGRAEGYGPAARDREVPSFDDYATAVAGGLIGACEAAGMALPELVLEPGRALVANAAVLLTTVGTIKVDGERSWVHVDASINHAIRAYTGNWHYHIAPVTKAPATAPRRTADVVGGLCDAADVLGRARPLPPLARGDVLAVLDVGAYAESAASNFNTEPRALAALVRGDEAVVVSERESVDDVLARQRVPDWLTPAGA